MNIKILDSWLREYLKTKAKPSKIAEMLSLTSVSVEKYEKYGNNDYLYDIEITTNRPDLMSVVGIAREAAAMLPQFNIKAEFVPPKLEKPKPVKKSLPINIKNNPRLVNRVIAVVLEINLKQSPGYIKERLEASGIRSLNNLIDITNYIMREIGHPTHVFDYDRLTTRKLIIRESDKGEKVVTLDGKEHTLLGGDIVADNGEGEIIDLLGVMGTANSVITDKTKRIVLFIDNNEPYRIRKTSMSLAVRTEAAVLNEKGVDPELGMKAILRGIYFYEKTADAKLLSNIIDIYPNIPKVKKILINTDKINRLIGIEIPVKTSVEILKRLGFEVNVQGKNLNLIVPSWRNNDIEIEEDVIEEIARIYGFYKLPNVLPPLTKVDTYHQTYDPFYWEKRVKNALKYWGFTEIYTYSMVSEILLEGPVEEALTLANPLSEDMVYLRKTLVPSLLSVVRANPNRDDIRIFELANVYLPKEGDLPNETLRLSGIIKKEKVSFHEVKGIIEAVLSDLGIQNIVFKDRKSGGTGAEIYCNNDCFGEIEILNENIIDFELNFETILKYANLKISYKPIAKYPPIIEDVSLIVNPNINYENIVKLIKEKSKLVADISLIDIYDNKRTFRIRYQHPEKNLTTEEVAKERQKIYSSLEKNLGVKIT